MQIIDHAGFVYRTAYPFDNKPLRVDLCLLPWRFVAFGLSRLLLSLFTWVFFIGFGVVVAWGVHVILLLFGQTFERRRSMVDPYIVGAGLLNRLTALNYEPVPMELPVIAGKRVLPIYPIVAVAIAWAAWHMGPAIGEMIVSGALVILNALVAIAQSFWLPFLIFIVALFATMVFRKFLRSEASMLFIAYLKAKKEKICPILEVV